MASKDPNISKQDTAGKQKHPALIIPKKIKIIRRFESGESQIEVMAS
jgi:hypothetical protein